MLSYTPRKLQSMKITTKLIKKQSLPAPNNIPQILTFLSRQHRTSSFQQPCRQTLSTWLTECIPTFRKSPSSLPYSTFFSLCRRIKYHRTQYFDIAESCWGKLTAWTLWDLVMVYTVGVGLRHEGNREFLGAVRTEIWRRFRADKVITDRKLLIDLLIYLEALGLDPSITHDEKNGILQQLSGVLQKSIPTFKSLNSQRIYTSLYQLYLLQNLTPTLPQSLLSYLQQIHESPQTSSFAATNNFEQQHAPHESIFQKIFQNHLTSLGYQFDLNTVIKYNQYDVIVKAKRQRNCPLKGVLLGDVEGMGGRDGGDKGDGGDRGVIGIEKVRELAELRLLEWFDKKTEMEKVVINLNGPTHYIISNKHPKYTITRKQQFNYQKLALYGIYKYNTICYETWQNISRRPKDVQKYTQDKINNPICLPKYPHNPTPI